jgi:hypothetical protein
MTDPLVFISKILRLPDGRQSCEAMAPFPRPDNKTAAQGCGSLDRSRRVNDDERRARMSEIAPKPTPEHSDPTPEKEAESHENRHPSRWIAHWVQLPLFDPDDLRSRIWGDPPPSEPPV